MCVVTCLRDEEPRVQMAYPVPWRVLHRNDDGSVTIQNETDAVLRSVRFSAQGRGVLALSLPRRVLPGERITVRVLGVLFDDGSPRAPDAMLVVRWQHPDGTELLWPIAW